MPDFPAPLRHHTARQRYPWFEAIPRNRGNMVAAQHLDMLKAGCKTKLSDPELKSIDPEVL